ncbi:MAG: hypothetical protein KGY61_10485 [Desulfobacterales bacterium]|nr:hypothetical protein [Desulfobacterales bacterium]
MIQQTIVSCDDIQCFMVTEHFFEYFSDDTGVTTFDRALLDLSRIYENAVLVGAIAVSKYVQPPIEPRVTFDIDAVLDEKDFADFLNDELPEEKARVLETYFETSDSVSHSLKHKNTGIYLDFLSIQSEPVRKKLVRHILEDRESATNLLSMNGNRIHIAKPELIIAMKLNRYAKKPKSEKGLADRLDIVKMMKSYHDQKDLLDPDKIREFINRRESRYLEEILADVACEVCEA